MANTIFTPTRKRIPKLSGIYVYGNSSKVADSWVAKVTKFRNGINQKDLFTIK